MRKIFTRYSWENYFRRYSFFELMMVQNETYLRQKSPMQGLGMCKTFKKLCEVNEL